MKTPAFFEAEAPTPFAMALKPLGNIYGAITARRMARTGAKAPCPVICVGNFTVGGAGKTPTAIMVARILRDLGKAPVFLSRGYGGRLAGPVLVDVERHGASEVGDEPLLLARSGPAVIARDRPAGAMLAARHGDVVVMDDGLQNPSLAKDLSLTVIDGAVGFGNRLCLPAGPLRAPLSAQWPRIDAAILIGEGSAGAVAARGAHRHGKPVLHGALRLDATIAARLRGRRVFAFAGIGRPRKFFETLEAFGALVVDRRSFADHHPFDRAEIDALIADAAREGLELVTTEKDEVRLRGLLGPAGTAGITAVPVHLHVEDEDIFRDLIARHIPC